MKSPSKNLYYPWSREIEYFMVCADSKSFVQASERAGVGQPALTKAIRALEDQMGTSLFYRKPSGIELTRDGQSLTQALLKTKSQWETEIGESQTMSGYRGVLRLGCHASVASNTFPLFLPAIIDKYPDLKVETVFDTSLSITRMVADLKIDIGLVVNPVKNPNLVLRPIQNEFIALWKSASEHTETLLYNPEMYLGEKILKKFEHYRKIPMSDYEVIGKTIAGSNFVGFLPNAIAERYDLKRIGEKLLTVKLTMIYRKDMAKDIYISEAIQLIQSRLS